MQYTVARVCAFTRKGQLSLLIAVKANTPVEQLKYPCRTFCDKYARGFFVHQACARRQRVAQVYLRRVVGAQRHRDSTLCILCVRFRKFALGQAEHRAVAAQFNRAAQSCNAGAHNDKIVRRIHNGESSC